MAEIKMTRVQLLNITEQLENSSSDDLIKVISLLVIASHHVEASEHPARATTLYVLTLTIKVMEKYNEMMVNPRFSSSTLNINYRKHIDKVVAQLRQFSSEI